MPDETALKSGYVTPAKRRVEGQSARDVGERAKQMITDLFERNRALSEEVRAIRTRRLPPLDDAGYEVWRALMEDLRDDGQMRLEVRTQTVMEVTYEPV